MSSEWFKKNFKYLWLGSVVLLFTFLFIYGYDFQEHNLFADEGTRLTGWCNNNMPLRNYSEHPNVGYCFGDGWELYKPVWEKRCEIKTNEECISDSLNPLEVKKELLFT